MSSAVLLGKKRIESVFLYNQIIPFTLLFQRISPPPSRALSLFWCEMKWNEYSFRLCHWWRVVRFKANFKFLHYRQKIMTIICHFHSECGCVRYCTTFGPIKNGRQLIIDALAQVALYTLFVTGHYESFWQRWSRGNSSDRLWPLSCHNVQRKSTTMAHGMKEDERRMPTMRGYRQMLPKIANPSFIFHYSPPSSPFQLSLAGPLASPHAWLYVVVTLSLHKNSAVHITTRINESAIEFCYPSCC